ncbi:D-alanyl-D-alanine carboxypeptidase family protein [Streptomyces sp. NPDC048639]|uniref:D-alanyl-D-alanine carboxypeptidase family protein n=1 Tax=Streptomyces sp. NPDC048639 TaxID=3365581 RepID=UPI00371CE334
MDTMSGLNTRTGAAAVAVACLAVACPAAPAHADGEGQHHAVPAAVGGPLLSRSGVQVLPGKAARELPSGLSALSWMVSDARTGQVLAAKDAHRRLAPASTLKTLFAVTVLPKLPQTALHKVTRNDLADLGAGSSQVGIQPGKSYAVSDLWRGVFLRSGNDAVSALASMNGSMTETISQMRAKAKALGAYDTRVVSADGYDAPGQVSSAYDLSLFALAGLANPDFVRYSSTGVAEFPEGRKANGKVKRHFQIQNTNRLLTGAPGLDPYRGLIGVKNGYTSHAGNTLVVAAKRGGRTLVATVMNPQSGVPNAVYEEARSLLDWGFSSAGRVAAVGRLQSPPSVAVRDAVHPPRVEEAGMVNDVTDHVPGGGGAVWLAGAAGAVTLCGGALLLRMRRGPFRRRM